VTVVEKSEALKKLKEIISTTRQVEKQEKVWDYLLFLSSAFVVASGLYAAFMTESFFMTVGWVVSLYWILSTAKFRKERDAFRDLWLGALQEIIIIGQQDESTKEEGENK